MRGKAGQSGELERVPHWLRLPILGACLSLALLVGELTVRAGVPLPRAVVGLLLMALVLHLSGSVRNWLDGAGHTVVGWLGAFVTPVFVLLAGYWPLLEENALGVLLVLLVTTPLAALVAAFLYRAAVRLWP